MSGKTIKSLETRHLQSNWTGEAMILQTALQVIYSIYLRPTEAMFSDS